MNEAKIPAPEAPANPPDFIRKRIREDVAKNKNHGRVITRFPPEPNGYLHIGHAKAINLNFGIAREYQGACHLRLDDTNPEKEEQEYIDAIREDVRWLGFDWGGHLYHASDYYDRFYTYAVELIEKGLAYVCHLSPDAIREYRGTLTTPGKNSPFRQRPADENRALFERMRRGEFKEGECVLRAKIDMEHPNINMRDPAIYRIKHAAHPRTGDKWCIYPMYDFAHCISDALENITHSLCTLEFEDHRPLYDWVLDNITIPCHPQQIEFARLELTHTLLSKRKLLQLVQEGIVNGWDDPRLPTIRGLRRRGYTPEAIGAFCRAIGVDKTNSVIDIGTLEYHLREDLNRRAQRVMAVLHPLKVVIVNYPDNQAETFSAENNPEDPASGTRPVPFAKTLYIEQEDFQESPPKGYFRLAPGREVRLKHAYYITCQAVIKDEATGEIKEIHCTYDPGSRGGSTPDGRRVKGTLHWVAAEHALDAEVRLYSHLFTRPDPNQAPAGQDFRSALNPQSLVTLPACKVEPSLRVAMAGDRFQFMRHGYFCVDPDTTPARLVFNRTATLRDTWAKMMQKGQGQPE
ncbi:glutamine--tRNA ligase/YqeY domain fusion protein [candidate division FCPU426 bacterium]|nr:glutamine--tRNA ligase/YqeY domain fusion protein [candidate division FCPU426 bacterium]